MINLTELAQKIKKEKRVALISHVRPDGDTLGSAVALKLALTSLGIAAEVFCADSVPKRFFFQPELTKIGKEPSGEYSAFIAIDCADLLRLGDLAGVFSAHKNTYSIDHHSSNSRFAKINYVSENASNCENIFGLIKELGAGIDPVMANLLLMGVSTDTGNFCHKNVTPNTLRIAAELLEAGADINRISYYMFNAQTKQRAALFGVTMSAIRYFMEGKIAVATVSDKSLKATGALAEETEGFIDFVMGISGVEVAACVLETAKNAYKVSLRSRNVDVCAVASEFGGGGHVLASGCRIQGEYEDVIDRLTFAIKKYIPE